MSQKKVKLTKFKLVKLIPREEKIRVIEKVKKCPKVAEFDVAQLNLNEIVHPEDENKPREHFSLLEEAYDIALPRLLRLREKYPQGSFVTIGMSSVPVNRDAQYVALEVFYPRSFFSPKLKIEEQILYRSHNKFNALMVEYLLQFHISEGLWKDFFGGLFNPQKKAFPHLPEGALMPWMEEEEETLTPYYVYVKFSKSKMTFAIKDDDDVDKL